LLSVVDKITPKDVAKYSDYGSFLGLASNVRGLLNRLDDLTTKDINNIFFGSSNRIQGLIDAETKKLVGFITEYKTAVAKTKQEIKTLRSLVRPQLIFESQTVPISPYLPPPIVSVRNNADGRGQRGKRSLDVIAIE
jgi:hypothetical protein